MIIMTKQIAVIYARQSTPKQQSIPAQIKALEGFADEKSYHIVATFEDAMSGKDTNRQGFKTMKEFLSKHSVDIILVWRYDRIARNLKDLESFLTYCYELNVSVISINERLGNHHAQDVFMLQLLGALGQYQREVIKENQQIAYRQKHLQGKILSANVSYGYRLVDGDLELQQDEALIVKEIFNLYVNQEMGYKAIAENLNAAGKLNRDGIWWHPTRIKSILDNPFYIGKVLSKYGSTNTHSLPLIEPVVFEKVQQIQASRNTASQRVTRRYVLQGKIKCPHCQTVCTPTHTLSNQRDHYYYACSQYTSGGKRHCSGIRINALNIEHLISTQLFHFIQSPYVSDQLESHIAQKNDHIEKYNHKKQNQLIKRQTRLLKDYEKGIISDKQLSTQLNELIKRKEKLNLKPLIPESITDLIDFKLFVDINPTLNQYLLFQSILHWIEVDEDKKLVAVYLKGFNDNILEEEFYVS